MPTPIEQLRALLPDWEQCRREKYPKWTWAVDLDLPAIIAWAEGLERQLADARHAIKVSLGIGQGVSWKTVPDSAVGGWIESAVALRDKP